MTNFQNGDRVEVIFPSGQSDTQKLPGMVLRTQDPGPLQAHPERTLRIKFDDSMVMGGLGMAWVSPESVSVLT